jgi:hypothetical protein
LQYSNGNCRHGGNENCQLLESHVAVKPEILGDLGNDYLSHFLLVHS